MDEFERCLRDGRIVRYEPSEAMVQKELAAARLDLDTATESLGKGNIKWATTQGYYSMFHSAKALVLWKGFRERSHWCLLVALRELLVRTGELDEDIADDLELCMGVRHGADYALEYDATTAGRVVEKAGIMLGAARVILVRAGASTSRSQNDDSVQGPQSKGHARKWRGDEAPPSRPGRRRRRPSPRSTRTARPGSR